MNSNSFTLSETSENAVNLVTLNRFFNSVQYAGLAEQNEYDRCWLQYEADSLKEEYQQLDSIDLNYLIEAHICAVLEDLFRGHNFKILAQVNPVYSFDTYFRISVFISVL